MYAVKSVGKVRVFVNQPYWVFSKKVSAGHHQLNVTACMTSSKIYGTTMDFPSGYTLGLGAYCHGIRTREENLTDLFIQIGPFRINILHRKTV